MASGNGNGGNGGNGNGNGNGSNGSNGNGGNGGNGNGGNGNGGNGNEAAPVRVKRERSEPVTQVAAVERARPEPTPPEAIDVPPATAT
jgi:hypothetical protein